MRDGKGCNLYWKFGYKETLKDYTSALAYLGHKYYFKSFTVDNKSGLIKALSRLYPATPIQLCQFHSVKAVLKYIGRKPQSHCGRSIKKLILKLTTLTKTQFIEKYQKLILRHKDFIQERNYLGGYKHQEIRSALNSMQANIAFLFTYLDYPNLNIPNTNNSMEGYFGQHKFKIKLHRGLSREHKIKILNQMLQDDIGIE